MHGRSRRQRVRHRRLASLMTTRDARAGHDLVLTWVTLPPEGIRVRYHGDARDSDSHRARAAVEEITQEIARLALMDSRVAHAGPASAALAVRLPLRGATAVIENITARQDMVSGQLYGHPWVIGGSWPTITPCF